MALLLTLVDGPATGLLRADLLYATFFQDD